MRECGLGVYQFLVGKGASVDGSTMITYSVNSYSLFGALYHYPAATHAEGTMRPVYEWDTGKYLGEIPEAAQTYNVVGNMNEHQLTIGETTYGGRDELVDTTGIIDYGSLMYIALQRARNAREAIRIMTDLVAQYGYCSSGESFSIADPHEVWILELIGKGVGNKGVDLGGAPSARRLRVGTRQPSPYHDISTGIAPKPEQHQQQAYRSPVGVRN